VDDTSATANGKDRESIARRHVANPPNKYTEFEHCIYDGDEWPCDAAMLLLALEEKKHPPAYIIQGVNGHLVLTSESDSALSFTLALVDENYRASVRFMVVDEQLIRDNIATVASEVRSGNPGLTTR
jgi:hypothetical protein